MAISINAYQFEPDSTVQIGEYAVTLHHDIGADNPRNMTDCACPMAWFSLESYGVTVHEDEYYVTSFFGNVSEFWVSRHWRKIAEILDLDKSQFDQECKETRSDYGGPMGEIRRDLFREVLNDTFSNCWGGQCDRFAALQSLYQLAGIPTIETQVNGYTQGDSIRILAVNLPEWRKKVGAPNTAETLQGEIDEFGCRAFGDVWGYSIEGPDGEELDACYGFYGSYYDDSFHMWEEVRNAIEYNVQLRKKTRNNRLRDLIRNRVPLGLRSDILNAA